MDTMKWFVGICFTVALLFLYLISAIELAVYGDMGYFQREYQKYEVAEEVAIGEENLLFVTKEMMDYLKGKREDLVVETIIDGQRTEFFNDKEKAHMKDVQALFLKGIQLRRLAILVLLVTGAFLWRQKAIKTLWQAVQRGMLLFLIGIGIVSGIIATDFTKYFTIFHEIFFSNDLWLLNPATDRLINIVPEPFFIDTAIRIGLFFGSMVVGSIVVATVLLWREKRTGV